ncbi:hypothetical protein BC936DRAFT_145770 [Jimgerdemannia flammicorona]|uniref:GSKIP domain-containing protein n=1 Tax=Jimgerdemannia flammicorona TaxID=994334 RepID=A0A433D954_9FUNG|nr:hypothetical protein BC936DRAFT_145770 [Jimgerdemannia flammicorona]
MKAETIHEELQSIIVSYDYGIVPKSARVISVNDARGSGEVELGLLEGVTIVVSVSDRGFQVMNERRASEDPVGLACFNVET